MPMTKCPDCGREVSTIAVSCPQCGRPFKTEPQIVFTRPKTSVVTWSCAIVAGMGLLIFIGVDISYNRAKYGDSKPQESTLAAAAPGVAPNVQITTAEPVELEVISAVMKKGETEEPFTKFSYAIAIRNNADAERRVFARVVFTDAEGRKLDDLDIIGPDVIDAHAIKEFNGEREIQSPDSYRVAKVRAELK